MGQRIIHGFIPLARSLKMAVTKEKEELRRENESTGPLSTEFFGGRRRANSYTV